MDFIISSRLLIIKAKVILIFNFKVFFERDKNILLFKSNHLFAYTQYYTSFLILYFLAKTESGLKLSALDGISSALLSSSK